MGEIDKKRTLNFPVRNNRNLLRGKRETSWKNNVLFNFQHQGSRRFEIHYLKRTVWNQPLLKYWIKFMTEVYATEIACRHIKKALNSDFLHPWLCKEKPLKRFKTAFHAEQVLFCFSKLWNFFLLSRDSMESFYRRYLWKTLSIRKIKRFFTLDPFFFIPFQGRPHFSLENSLHKLLHLRRSTRCFAPWKG